MREIKFRAWDMVQNVMRGWDWLEEKQGTYLNSKYFHAMQYTGLHDKNGKEIYEGDLVEEDEKIYEVKWQDDETGFFPFADFPENCGCCGSGSFPSEVKIIGNIHENPKLIKTI